MLAAKPISISAANFFMFSSGGSIWMSQQEHHPPRTSAKKVSIGLSVWKPRREALNLWDNIFKKISFAEISGSWIIFFKTIKLLFLLSGCWFFLRVESRVPNLWYPLISNSEFYHTFRSHTNSDNKIWLDNMLVLICSCTLLLLQVNHVWITTWL